MRYALPLGSAYYNPPQPPQKYGGFLIPKIKKHKIKTIIFYSRKAAESEENICHFLLRQLVYFKPL